MLDLCTGTGCIPLLLHHELFKHPDVVPNIGRLVGVDISSQALKVSEHNKAKQIHEQSVYGPSNSAKLNALRNMHFAQADILADEQSPSSVMSQLRAISSAEPKYEILISNPPYISSAAFRITTAASVRRYEPKLALVPPHSSAEYVVQDGDAFYPELYRIAKLVKSKVVLFEVADIRSIESIDNLRKERFGGNSSHSFNSRPVKDNKNSDTVSNAKVTPSLKWKSNVSNKNSDETRDGDKNLSSGMKLRSRCFNCQKPGHMANECKEEKHDPWCSACRKMGHFRRDCPEKNATGTGTSVNKDKVVTMVDENQVNNDVYYRECSVDGQKVSCMIDNGACNCIMKASQAIKLRREVNLSKEARLYGFGSMKEGVQVLGTFMATVKLDEVEIVTSIVVVEDETIHVPLVIGRNWIDYPGVTYAKAGGILKFYRIKNATLNKLGKILVNKPAESRVKICASKDCVIEGGKTNFIGAIINEPFCGSTAVFQNMNGTEALVRVQPKTEFLVPIVSYGRESSNIKEGEVLCRASVLRNNDCLYVEPYEKSEFFTADKINCPANTDICEKEMLCSLINEFRDAFAENVRELSGTDVAKMKIIEKPGSVPVCRKPYRLSAQDTQELKRIVEEWKKAGLVEDTSSPYASPA
jgi:hypothetical protein